MARSQGFRPRDARPTVHDVARLAGVSTASVSRALTGSRPVRKDVADRVRAAADELGYRPDAVGRSLRRGETKTIGLVVADITIPFFPALVQAVEYTARQAGFGLLVADSQNSADTERANVAMLLDRQIDGLLITPCHRRQSRSTVAEAARAIRVVQLDRVASAQAQYVGVDQDAAIVDILAHLSDLGRRHFAFLGSDPSVSTSWERQQAYIRHASVRDIAARERVMVGEFSAAWGRVGTARLMDRWAEIDALICANDLIALGAVQELHRRGLTVPGDVAVTGFDNTILGSAFVPAFTTVDQSVVEIADRAVSVVMTPESDYLGRPLHYRVRAKLIVRESSGGVKATGLVLPDYELVTPT